MDDPRNSSINATADPLLGPQTGMEQPPLLRSEFPPLRPSLLDISPVGRRMENLDALRIVCMLVIIITHVTEPFIDAINHRGALAGPLALGVLAFNIMGRFGVPCFMMISFFIYWHQLYEKGRSWGELLARRLKRLVPAFVCWSAFYFLVHRQLWKVYGNDHRPIWKAYSNEHWYSPLAAHGYSIRQWQTWWDLLLGQAEYHLYYLPLVMQCLVCIPLLRLLWRKPAIAWGWIGATALAWGMLVYGPLLFAPGSPGLRLTGGLQHILDQPWAIPYLLFPLFGMMCAGQPQFRNFLARSSTRFWVGVLLIGLILHSVESIFLSQHLPHGPIYLRRVANYIKFGRLLSSFAVFALFIRNPLMRDPFPRISHYAFGLHFMHPFIIILITMTELKLLGPAIADYHSWVFPVLALNFLLTFCITFSLCLVIGRVKRLEFLVV